MAYKGRTSKGVVLSNIRAFAGKKSVNEIAEICGVIPSTVRKYAAQIGVSMELHHGVERRRILREYIQENHHMVTARQAAEELQMPKSTVTYTAWSMGLKFKRDTDPPTREKEVGNIFNPRLHENWIV